MARILVIEDEQPVRWNLVELLTEEGFHTLEAENGRLGVKVALAHPVRLRALTELQKKFKDKAFAAGANRDDIRNGAEELGVDLWGEHVPLVLTAMQGIAADLGLDGRLASA